MKILKGILITILIIGGIIGLAFYSFMQIDFIGHKSPEVMKANRERMAKMVLKAEFRDGTDYCKITLLDSVNIEINAGDKGTGTIMTEKYKVSGDTIIIIEGIKHAKKYMNSSELLIQDDQILYMKDNEGNFINSKTMKVKFNKLKTAQ